MISNEQKIRVYDLEGNFLSDFTSQREASEELGVDERLISRNINGYINFAENFQFRKIKLKTPLRTGNVLTCFNSGKKKKCIAKYFQGRLISVYKTYSEAYENNKIAPGIITHCVQRGTPYKGFTFKEVE